MEAAEPHLRKMPMSVAFAAALAPAADVLAPTLRESQTRTCDLAEATRLREQIRRVEEEAREAELAEEKRLREAIRRNPKNAKAHWTLGDLLKKRADATLTRALDAREAMTSSPPACAVCAAVDVMQCVRCKAVYYCSRRCQKTHWNMSHKRRCIPAEERAAFNTPSNAMLLWEAVRRGDPQVQFDSKRTQSPAYETCNRPGP